MPDVWQRCSRVALVVNALFLVLFAGGGVLAWNSWGPVYGILAWTLAVALVFAFVFPMVLIRGWLAERRERGAAAQ